MRIMTLRGLGATPAPTETPNCPAGSRWNAQSQKCETLAEFMAKMERSKADAIASGRYVVHDATHDIQARAGDVEPADCTILGMSCTIALAGIVGVALAGGAAYYFFGRK